MEHFARFPTSPEVRREPEAAQDGVASLFVGDWLRPATERPFYCQIRDRIVALMEAGTLCPGERLPSTRDLAALLGVGRGTAMTAYDELSALGFVVAHVGRGSFVVEGAFSPLGEREV